MDAANFFVEAEVERTHWWFSGRRRLFARELTSIGIGPGARILDVGTGTGANLRMLRELKLEHVTGLDNDELAIQFCASKGLGLVQRGDICAMPFAPGSFDLVIATDVIEHVDGDRAALAEIARVLRSGGNALISVPAFPSLWGLQDVVAHHKRRYRLRLLLQTMREAGLEPYRYYHFNYLLFAPIWMARRLIRWLGLKYKSEAELNGPVLNWLLSGVFRIDIRTAPVLRLPFGVSILLIGRKTKACGAEINSLFDRAADNGGCAPEGSAIPSNEGCDQANNRVLASMLDLLRCPETDTPLVCEDDQLRSPAGGTRYNIGDNGIPIFSAQMSRDASTQHEHYQKIAADYIKNLAYPHTEEYMAYLDRMLLDVVDVDRVGTIAELCCGHGGSFKLLNGRSNRRVGVDISVSMLEEALKRSGSQNVMFVQGDVTKAPLATAAFDSVFVLGGIHHINDRTELFKEIHRILKPGGRLYFREPVSDFFLWRWIRGVIYRIAPALDHRTERPLRREETISAIEKAGLSCCHYRTHGFLGFCVFMNSDVLVFNRAFRFVPGIRWITRMIALLDEMILRLPGFHLAGLQVVGVAEKPAVAMKA